MSQLRQDITTGAQVLIAPQRGQRPHHRRPRASGDGAAYDPNCPFCPGNESQLAPMIADVPGATDGSWQIRVVANKFPIVSSAGNASGRHEVIIETPNHNETLGDLSEQVIAACVETYHQRSVALSARPGTRTVHLFRNQGADAGASLTHAHAQIIALDFMPPMLDATDTWLAAIFRDRQACPTCDVLETERRTGERLVFANDHIVCLVPFAAAGPCEMWLLPRRHQAAFVDCDSAQRLALAAALRRGLAVIRAALDDPPYNFVIDSAPVGRGDSPYWHWRLRLVPDLRTPAGFELGTAVAVNPSSPEDDAALLRANL